MDNQNPMNDFAAMFDEHQVTDEEGQIAPETETEVQDSAPETTQTTDEEFASAEKPPVMQEAPAETEQELAEDESGKRYVPKERFDEIYGKAKRLEREMEQYKSSIGQTQTTKARPQSQKIDKTELLEVEILKSTLPQFNPDSDQYDPDLDDMGGMIYKANPGITRIEAARQALRTIQKLAEKRASVTAEARAVKSIQSDRGITSRTSGDRDTTPNINEMNDVELEKFMKRNGMW